MSKTRYTLQSTPMVYTPGIISWAINGGQFAKDRPQMIKLLQEAYKLPHEVATGLIDGSISYEVSDDQAVVFDFENTDIPTFLVTTGRKGIDLEVDYTCHDEKDAKSHAKDLRKDFSCENVKVREFASDAAAQAWIDEVLS